FLARLLFHGDLLLGRSIGRLLRQSRGAQAFRLGVAGAGLFIDDCPRGPGRRVHLDFGLREFRLEQARFGPASHTFLPMQKRPGEPDLLISASTAGASTSVVKGQKRDCPYAALRFSAALLPLRASFTMSKLTFWPSTRDCIPERSTA